MMRKYEDLTDEHKAEIRTIHETVQDEYRTAYLSNTGITIVRRVLSEPWIDVEIDNE